MKHILRAEDARADMPLMCLLNIPHQGLYRACLLFGRNQSQMQRERLTRLCPGVVAPRACFQETTIECLAYLPAYLFRVAGVLVVTERARDLLEQQHIE